MRVDVDESRRDDAAFGVDLRADPTVRRIADRDDPISADGDIGVKRRASGAVDNDAAANHQIEIVRHRAIVACVAPGS